MSQRTHQPFRRGSRRGGRDRVPLRTASVSPARGFASAISFAAGAAYSTRRIRVGVRAAERALARPIAFAGAKPPPDGSPWLLPVAQLSFARGFSGAHDRTLRALDRISAASLEAPEVLGFLNKLLGVLLETTRDVDVVKIMLREGEDLVVRVAAGGLEEDLRSGFRLRVGEGFSGKIAAERKPAMVPLAADADVKSAELRKIAQRALYGVPLLHHDDLIGVALMGSTTAYQFSDEDLLLFRTMTGRATALIVQGQCLEREKIARAEAEGLAKELEASLALRD